MAAGLICLLPRGVTGPIPGSIVNPVGFSVLHSNCVVSPGLIEAGFASNETTRGAGCGLAFPRPCACSPELRPAKANTSITVVFKQTSRGFESVKSVQSVANSCLYDLISRPSASFMRLLIIEGAPLFAGDPVQEIMSPGFTVLLVQP